MIPSGKRMSKSTKSLLMQYKPYTVQVTSSGFMITIFYYSQNFFASWSQKLMLACSCIPHFLVRKYFGAYLVCPI